MESNFKNALKLILKHEGGFVNHPKDPGGATNKGITIETYRVHYGRDKTVQDLKDIPQDHLESIYKEGYWDKAKCNELPSGVDIIVFDMAVNAGVKRAAIILQRAVGVEDDGAIGPLTLEAVAKNDPVRIIKNYTEQRMKFYRSLKHWDTFGKGWSIRAYSTEEVSKAFASKLKTPTGEEPEETIEVTETPVVTEANIPNTSFAGFLKKYLGLS